MPDFDPSKSNLGKEFKEFISSAWKQYPFAMVSSGIIGVGFFIPNFNFLIWLYASIAVPIIFYKNEKVQNFFRVKSYKKLLTFAALFVITFVGFFIPVAAYSSIVSPVPKKTEVVKEDTTKLDIEKQKRQEAESKAKLEESKRIEAEQSKQELEGKIAEAEKVNPNYDFGSDLEAQDIPTTVKANLAIAALGRETKDQKLFTVTQVVDGDTIKVSDLGTLRLIGIDTPETKDPRKVVQCFGVEASNRAKELLTGKNVYLVFDPANRIDKYGRTLAYVFREDGYFFNAEMIKDGYANSYTKYPHPRLEDFNNFQKEARENQRGLWSPSTCSGDTTKAASSSSSSVAPASSAPVVNQPVNNPPVNNNGGGYIAGTCGDLKKLGLGNFRVGDPNYTKTRDRDNDGIACEL
ncbi:MAG: thermonuclease family protein [bacterium]